LDQFQTGFDSNPNDFAGIEGLEVVPVPVPEVSAAGDETAD
jgi:hypothetical protein